MNRNFPVTAPIRVDGRIGHGSFTVTAVEDISEASVIITARAEPSAVLDQTTVELRDGTLRIASPRQGGLFDLFSLNARDAIDVEVTVPSGTPVKIGTFTASVTVTGRCGNADIAAGASDVTLDHVDGNLRLRYGSGECRVERVTGSVQAKSGSGTAVFGEIGGALTSATGHGQLEVTTVHGKVRSRSGSGNAVLGAVYGDVDVVSGSGALSIGVPAGVSARLDLTSGSGQIESELPIATDQPTAQPAATGRPITIRARTGNGDVRLFRAAAVAA